MGNFFTSTQIYNEGMVKSEKFIDMFCKAMKKEGYVTCEGDESEKSYILRFADNCRWVTIASEDYDEENAAADAGKIAKMLGTTCVNTNVIDSDCAVMELYNEKGTKADTLIMGRADDYFGENIPLPAENTWKSFLTEGSSWEKLTNLVENSEEYTFVEDGLSELAPIIGMDDSNILFSAEDATEGDEQTVFLCFRKSEAKKEKKVTPKAAFKQVFGEMLEPLGYVYAKTKMPSFMKIVNGDMVKIISLYDNTETLSVNAGIFTLYREKINLNDHKWDNYWFKKTGYFLSAAKSTPNNTINPNNCFYSYEKNDISSIYYALNTLLLEVKEFVLKIFDNVNDLKDFVNYQILMNMSLDYFAVCDKINPKSCIPCSDGAMVFAISDPFCIPKTVKEQGLVQMKYRLEHKIDNITVEQYESMVKRINDRYDKAYNLISYVINNPEFYEKTMQELKRRKTENLKTLKTYGVNI